MLRLSIFCFVVCLVFLSPGAVCAQDKVTPHAPEPMNGTRFYRVPEAVDAAKRQVHEARVKSAHRSRKLRSHAL